jgi:hypothetical protein
VAINGRASVGPLWSRCTQSVQSWHRIGLERTWRSGLYARPGLPVFEDWEPDRLQSTAGDHVGGRLQCPSLDGSQPVHGHGKDIFCQFPINTCPSCNVMEAASFMLNVFR